MPDRVEFKFSFGEEVKAAVTGFCGVVKVRDQWDTGCKRYGILSKKLHNGKPLPLEWFDEVDLVGVKKTTKKSPDKQVGGPHGSNPSPYNR